MKRFFLIILLLISISSGFACAYTDLNSEDSSVEIQVNDENPEESSIEYYDSDIQEVETVEDKYKDYVIDLNVEDNDNAKVNESGALYILQAEKNYRPQMVEAVNMFWDNSKNFINSYYQDSRNMSPMPVLINSSYISTSVNNYTKAYVGQSSLSSFDDTPVYFVRSNETTFNTGFKIVTRSEKFNFSAGTYNSTLNNLLSGGAVISTNPLNLNGIKGSFVLGGGYYTNELENDNKNTGGLFGEYKYKRLKLNLQASESKYTNSSSLETGLYFTPEIQLTDSLSLKTRFIKNITQDTNQDEIGFSYKPLKNNSRNFEFEVNAANTYSPDSTTKQRLRFNASFKI